MDIADLLKDGGDVATCKAALQVLVQEVRVDRREAIIPDFRVPLHAPVRTLTRTQRETGVSRGSAKSAATEFSYRLAP